MEMILLNLTDEILENCQELDGSGLLGMSRNVVLRKQGVSGAMVYGSEESAKLKLDKR